MLMRLLIMSENELCLRMQKTTAQTQSIKRAVKQTPTLTISIPDIGAIQDVDRHCQSRSEREHLLALAEQTGKTII